MRSRMLATTVVGLALLLTGCGGDDEDSTSASETQSTTAVSSIAKADYITQADAICKTEGDATDQGAAAAIQELGTEEPTPEQLATIASDVVLPSLEKQLAGLKALPKPSEGAADVDALLAELETAITAAKEDPSILAGSENGENPFTAANEKAVAIGLKECGSE